LIRDYLTQLAGAQQSDDVSAEFRRLALERAGARTRASFLTATRRTRGGDRMDFLDTNIIVYANDSGSEKTKTVRRN
jgi:hypothetical protein